MITVEGEKLSGDDVHVDVREVLPGGMMAQPIPGHMLQTVERTPQVRVRYKIILVCFTNLLSGSCEGQRPTCWLQWRTPTLP